jgi:hypothetical protein
VASPFVRVKFILAQDKVKLGFVDLPLHDSVFLQVPTLKSGSFLHLTVFLPILFLSATLGIQTNYSFFSSSVKLFGSFGSNIPSGAS